MTTGVSERREFLRQALEQCSSDWESENLVGCIKCLTEEESVMNEGSDVERQVRNELQEIFIPNGKEGSSSTVHSSQSAFSSK